MFAPPERRIPLLGGLKDTICLDKLQLGLVVPYSRLATLKSARWQLYMQARKEGKRNRWQ